MVESAPVQPVTPPPQATENKHRPRWTFSVWRLVVGAFIVLFGLQLLAQNYGWHWSLQVDPTRLWPIVLILVGLSMITKGRVVNFVVGSILAASVLAIAAVIMITQPTMSRETVTRTIKVPRELTATAGVLRVDLGAADIHIRGGETDLVTGQFVSNIGNIVLDTSVSATDQVVTIDSTNERRPWTWFSNFKNSLDLRLTNDLPFDLDLDTGAASLDLDLTTIQSRRVTVDAGASSINLALGDAFTNQIVKISSGASSIDISIPKTLTGIRMNLDAGLSGKTIPNELKKISDDLYETDGYATAEKKLDLTIDAGASSINLHWK